MLPRPAHQHLAAEDGVLGLPDAGCPTRITRGHDQIAAYFDDYVDHFGIRDRIRFETKVEHAGREADGTWVIRASDGTTRALRRAARRQRPSLGPALAGAGVPRERGLPGRAAARARVHEPRLPARQGRRRPGHGQQRDGHRRRVLVRRAEHVSRGAPRRVDHPEVHLRQADRPARGTTRGSRSRSARRRSTTSSSSTPATR